MFIRTAKRMLRKLLDEFRGNFWDELLPEVLIGLRHSVSLVHGLKPCEVAYKQPIRHPCDR